MRRYRDGTYFTNLVALLPQVVLGPVVGALVDRWDRRKVMIIADSGIALIGLVLVYLFWVDRLLSYSIAASRLACYGGCIFTLIMPDATR